MRGGRGKSDNVYGGSDADQGADNGAADDSAEASGVVDTAVATATAAGAEVTVSSSTGDNAYDISISWALGRCWC